MSRAIPILPRVMGILNVTPDSFSDGGQCCTLNAAVARARQMVRAGAAIIDVGGESTRPGAAAVPVETELARVLPVIKQLARRSPVPVSIDTRHPEVARAALAAGATWVNDVDELSEAMAAVAREHGATLVCRCRSRRDWQRLAKLTQLDGERLVLDPMIGFGTTRTEDLELIRRIPRLAHLAPVMFAVSRKRIVAHLAGDRSSPLQRLGGSVALALLGAALGASVIRVHDVQETVQALKVWRSCLAATGRKAE